MGQFNVLGPRGDVVVEWDPSDDEAVKSARDEFKRLRDAGFEFFEAGEPGGGKRKQVKNFRKALGKALAVPGVQRPADKKSGKRQKAMAGGPNDRVVR